MTDVEKPTEGFSIVNKEEGSTFTVKLECNPEVKDVNYQVTQDSNLLVTSTEACGSVNQAAKTIQNNKWVFCGIILVLGIVLLLFGGSHWKNLITILGFVAGCAGSLFIFWAFIKT